MFSLHLLYSTGSTAVEMEYPRLISSGSKSLVVFPSVRLPRRSMALVRNSMLSARADFPSPPWPSRQILRMSLAVYIRKLLLSWGPPPFTLRAVDRHHNGIIIHERKFDFNAFFCNFAKPSKKQNKVSPCFPIQMDGHQGRTWKSRETAAFPGQSHLWFTRWILPERLNSPAYIGSNRDPGPAASMSRPSIQALNWAPDMVS